jgi:hypothetical protein
MNNRFFKKPTINYVIATYPGKKCVTNRNLFVNSVVHTVHPKDYLKYHLEQLIAIKSQHITQITIMKALPPNGTECWEGYYNIKTLISTLMRVHGINVECINVPNYGLSYGQYIRAYKKYSSESDTKFQSDTPKFHKFDYYILMEDDYIPCIDNFDEKLIQSYQNKFYNKKTHFNDEGVLCVWASFAKDNQLHMAHSLCIVSAKTMKKVFFKQFKIQLEKLKHNCQINFSKIFTQANIPIKDYTNEYYTPYWNGKHLVDCCINTPENNTALFLPIQVIPNDVPGNIEFNFSCVPKHMLLKIIPTLH